MSNAKRHPKPVNNWNYDRIRFFSLIMNWTSGRVGSSYHNVVHNMTFVVWYNLKIIDNFIDDNHSRNCIGNIKEDAMRRVNKLRVKISWERKKIWQIIMIISSCLVQSSNVMAIKNRQIPINIHNERLIMNFEGKQRRISFDKELLQINEPIANLMRKLKWIYLIFIFIFMGLVRAPVAYNNSISLDEWIEWFLWIFCFVW